ncbi:MAG: substrate-binding domain-containing protein [Actinomycetota bacterium]|nr:substrate-binding domain-containing protein [Actinomycetota bacterium]MDA3028604.1 substrate-binding domain-containing protein [Actinomycetota bacterium]
MRKPLFAVLALSLAVAACGSDDDSSSDTDPEATPTEAPSTAGTTDESEPAPQGDERTQRAIDAGTAAALGEADLPSDITIGAISLAPIEIIQRIDDEMTRATEAIGWEYVSCDGQGTPEVMQTCGDSLLNQGVDALILTVIEPSFITPQLEQAKEMGIPVINVAGIINDDPELIAAQLSPAERELELTAALNEYVFEQLALRDEGDGTELSYSWFPLSAGELRRQQLEADLENQANVSVVATSENDMADFAGDARANTSAVLQANPDIDAFWEAAAPNIIPVADVVAQQFGEVRYPERPLIVGHLDDLQNLETIRSGRADAIGTYPVTIDAWVAVDQLAQFFAREDYEFERNATEESERVYGLTFAEYEVITEDNLPPAGEYVPVKEDVPAFFAAKWASEFGITPG